MNPPITRRGALRGAATAAGGAALAYLGTTLRQAGIRRTADLYRKTMANPELARAFISKMPTSADSGTLHNVARVLRRGLIVGPMLAGQPAQGPAGRGPVTARIALLVALALGLLLLLAGCPVAAGC